MERFCQIADEDNADERGRGGGGGMGGGGVIKCMVIYVLHTTGNGILVLYRGFRGLYSYMYV